MLQPSGEVAGAAAATATEELWAAAIEEPGVAAIEGLGVAGGAAPLGAGEEAGATVGTAGVGEAERWRPEP
jgi:hypothetical protein